MGIGKYNENEREVIGTWPGVAPDVADCYGYPIGEVPKFNTPVTPKENFMLFMQNKPFYWIPNMNADFYAICPAIIPDTAACGFKGGFDAFGVEWIQGSNPNLPALVKPGFQKLEDIEDWHELQFPDVDSWDWEGSAAGIQDLDGDRVKVGIIYSGFFERLIALMGFEDAAMSLLEDPEECADFMQALADYNISLIEHYKKYYDVDMVTIHDDWGAQRSPFFSHNTLREVILPAYKRTAARAHELGIYVLTHCCGNSESFVPEMIEIGSDMWQLQFNANPDLLNTMKMAGGNLKFDIRYIISEKEESQFHEFAKNFFDTYGKYKNAEIEIFNERFMLTPEESGEIYKLAREYA